MGVFKRMKDMSKASVNEVLDRMEDPVAMLKQYLRDMQEEIAKAEVATAKQIANERMLRERAADALARGRACERRALEALQNGQELTARKLLEEKLGHDERASDLAAFHAQSKEHADELLRQLHEQKDEFYRMRSKKSELEQRLELAKAKKRTAEMASVHRIDAGGASRGFQRMEEKIMQLEAEADVKRMSAAGLSGLGSYPASYGIRTVGTAEGAGAPGAPGFSGGKVYTPADERTQQLVEAELQRLREKQL